MRKTRHVWAAGNEHIKVHRSGSHGGGGGDGSGWMLLLWIGVIILGLIFLYYIWDFVQILLGILLLGFVARIFIRQ